MKTNPQDASGSYLGYIYQFLLAKYLAFEKSKDDIDSLLVLENFDDISFHDPKEDPVSLVQSKYSSSPKSIADSSVDLWKTIYNWILRDKEFSKKEQNPSFVLITSSKASKKSAAHYLKASEERSPEKACEILKDKALNLEGTETKKFRDAFSSLSDEKKLRLLNRVHVLDSAVDISEIQKQIIRKNFQAIKNSHHNPVYDRLLGWWVLKVIDALVNKGSIAVSELQSKLQDIAYQFHVDSLPIDFDVVEPSDYSSWEERVFVKQVKIVTDQSVRIKAAIRDYHRATEQRSRWAREDLLIDGEVEKYENRLKQEWEIYKAGLLDEMPNKSSNDKKKIGQKILKWIEQEADFKIRPNVHEPYVMRGTFHIMSDDFKIGLHPDFVTLLRKVLDE